MSGIARKVPRLFAMHWGGGRITEEASYLGRHHEPAFQLMEFDNGSRAIRFCYYSAGRFQRSPLMLGTKELKLMKAALHKTPTLHRLLRQLVS